MVESCLDQEMNFNETIGKTDRPINWLFVTSGFPWPLTNGTWLRVYHLTRTLLACGDRVSILSCDGEPSELQNYTQLGVRHIRCPRFHFGERGPSRCWFSPYIFDRLHAKFVAREAGNFDVVVLERPCMLQYSPEAAAAPCILADFGDDPILEERRKLTMELNPIRFARRVKFLLGEFRYETQYLKRVSASLFVTPEDTRNFARRHPGTRIACIPTAVDSDYFTRPARNLSSPDTPPTVIFVGNMAHPPNADAALFLVRNIAPLVLQQRPDVQFIIAGANPSIELRKVVHPNIKITGYVPDMRQVLWSASVALLPMQIGTGIKNKLMESWAAELAVVATPLACQGVPARDEENILLGRSPIELAQKTLRLIYDSQLQRKIAQNGRLAVLEHLTWSASARLLRALVFDLNPKLCLEAGVR